MEETDNGREPLTLRTFEKRERKEVLHSVLGR